MKQFWIGRISGRCTRVNILLLAFIISFQLHSQSCSPLSTVPCGSLQVGLPYALSFDSPVSGTLSDKNAAGTGFTLALPYSGTRLSQDGTPSNPSVPGYEAAKLFLTGGRLQLTSNKGIASTTSNNQLNALGVKVSSQGKLQWEVTIVNPYNGTSFQQAGLWVGGDDKTYLKLVTFNNKVQLYKEVNDVSGTSDNRLTATLAGLDTKTLRLRLTIDGTANTAEGYYSLDGGATYTSVGTPLSTAGMNLSTTTTYGGLFATYRNGTTPITYSFDEFSVKSTNQNLPPSFSPSSYNFAVTDNTVLGTIIGDVNASDPRGNALTYTITAGNTNNTFVIDSTTGIIKLAKYLNHHTQANYNLTVRASDGVSFSSTKVTITVNPGTTMAPFSIISWGSAANHPYGTHEVHGVVVNNKLYSFGGYDVQKRPNFSPTKRAYVYDPVANSWAAIADLPHTPNGSNFGGVTHVGLTTDGTDIYFAGGYPSNSTGTGQTFSTKQVWRYNVATNTYTALPNLPEALATGQLQYLSGKLHYFGGANASRADVKVHYVLNLDSLSLGWKPMAQLNDGRNHAGSAVCNGKIYSIGGSHGQDNATVTQKTIEVYDEIANTWTRLADMPIGLDHISSSVFTLGDRIFVLGGETKHDIRSNRVLVYTPATNTWTDLTPLPVTKSAGVAVALKGQIYYAGGNFSRGTHKGLPGVQQVTSFTVMNADTDQPLFTLTNGMTLNLDTLPTRNLNIRANLNSPTVGSVKFTLTGATARTFADNAAPYALYDDTNGDYLPWTPLAGSYTVKATPYTAANATGTAGTSYSVNFKVTTTQAASLVTSETTSDKSQTVQLKAYPNPSVSEPVRVDVYNLRQEEEASVVLVNTLGQVIEVKKIKADVQGNANTLLLANGRHTQPGFYLIQLQSRAGKTETKLMVK